MTVRNENATCEKDGRGKDPSVWTCLYALDAGDLDEMGKKYGGGREAEGFHYSLESRPSIILKRK
jgi:hypothetical protein